MLAECRDRIKEADIVLIGIGNEFNIKISDIVSCNPIYNKLNLEESGLNDLECQWIELAIMKDTIDRNLCDKVHDRIALYNKLYTYLKDNGKDNYFVVTTCSDDIIMMTDFAQDRMVAPCGTASYMKCDSGCFKYVYETKEVYDNINTILRKYVDEVNIDQKIMWRELKEAMPQCPMCKGLMSVNIVKTNNYSQEGYREKWDSYMAWLQKTLNKKLVMIELGEGFDTPTVIRWPFEKVVNVNNKATLIRVNEKFWQVVEEIEDKSLSIKMSGIDFIKELND